MQTAPGPIVQAMLSGRRAGVEATAGDVWMDDEAIQKMKGKLFVITLLLVIAFVVLIAQMGHIPVSASVEQGDASIAVATAHLSQTGTLDTNPLILMDSTTESGIGGSEVTFTAGGVSGGASWSSWRGVSGSPDFTSGGAPASGTVTVFGDRMTEIGEFALPLTGEVTYSGVRSVRVTVAVPLPALPEGTADMRSSYAAEAVASVHWKEA
jgi:hypothetical protein